MPSYKLLFPPCALTTCVHQAIVSSHTYRNSLLLCLLFYSGTKVPFGILDAAPASLQQQPTLGLKKHCWVPRRARSGISTAESSGRLVI